MNAEGRPHLPLRGVLLLAAAEVLLGLFISVDVFGHHIGKQLGESAHVRHVFGAAVGGGQQDIFRRQARVGVEGDQRLDLAAGEHFAHLRLHRLHQLGDAGVVLGEGVDLIDRHRPLLRLQPHLNPGLLRGLGPVCSLRFRLLRWLRLLFPGQKALLHPVVQRLQRLFLREHQPVCQIPRIHRLLLMLHQVEQHLQRLARCGAEQLLRERRHRKDGRKFGIINLITHKNPFPCFDDSLVVLLYQKKNALLRCRFLFVSPAPPIPGAGRMDKISDLVYNKANVRRQSGCACGFLWEAIRHSRFLDNST